MKKLLVATFMLALVSPVFTSCRETKEKTVVVEKEVEEENEGALERAAKKVDEEVNEEIDETIDEIGDDN
jgi:hypothetical protein